MDEKRGKKKKEKRMGEKRMDYIAISSSHKFKVTFHLIIYIGCIQNTLNLSDIQQNSLGRHIIPFTECELDSDFILNNASPLRSVLVVTGCMTTCTCSKCLISCSLYKTGITPRSRTPSEAIIQKALL